MSRKCFQCNKKGTPLWEWNYDTERKIKSTKDYARCKACFEEWKEIGLKETHSHLGKDYGTG